MAGVKWNLGVVQFNSVVGDVARNVETIRHYATLGRDLGLDLIVFPECCVTGYFLGDRMGELVDPVGGPAFQTIGEIASDAGVMLAVGAYTKDGDLVETCAASQSVITQLSKRIATHGGTALIVDYGDWRSLGDTLQALKDHKSLGILDQPGQDRKSVV